MNNKTVSVPAINCGHCTNTIEIELSEMTGVTNVSANVETKQVVIEWDEPATWEGIESLLKEIDFPPAA